MIRSAPPGGPRPGRAHCWPRCANPRRRDIQVRPELGAQRAGTLIRTRPASSTRTSFITTGLCRSPRQQSGTSGRRPSGSATADRSSAASSDGLLQPLPFPPTVIDGRPASTPPRPRQAGPQLRQPAGLATVRSPSVPVMPMTRGRTIPAPAGADSPAHRAPRLQHVHGPRRSLTWAASRAAQLVLVFYGGVDSPRPPARGHHRDRLLAFCSPPAELPIRCPVAPSSQLDRYTPPEMTRPARNAAASPRSVNPVRDSTPDGAPATTGAPIRRNDTRSPMPRILAATTRQPPTGAPRQHHPLACGINRHR